ncbi:MAG: hypothetical protein IKO10_09855, partial [Lachnospiraceae bacterium]|nr:hypothetical protein [Lachnospiraceae bacterium]
QVIEYFRKMMKRYPDVHFDFHAHNDYDLAVSNSLAAVLSGARGLLETHASGAGRRRDSRRICKPGKRTGRRRSNGLLQYLRIASVWPERTHGRRSLPAAGGRETIAATAPPEIAPTPLLPASPCASSCTPDPHRSDNASQNKACNRGEAP